MALTCNKSGCNGKRVAKGLCSKHYHAARRRDLANALVSSEQREAELVAKATQTTKGTQTRWVIDRNDIYTQSELAKLFQLNNRQISEAISELKSAGQVSGRLAYNLPEAARAVWGLNIGDLDADDPYAGLKPAERKALIDSQIRFVDLQEILGKYTKTDETHAFLAEKFKTLDLQLSTLPDHIEREAGLSPDQLTVVDREVDKMRIRLLAGYGSGDEENET